MKNKLYINLIFVYHFNYIRIELTSFVVHKSEPSRELVFDIVTKSNTLCVGGRWFETRMKGPYG
jgi:hypothetical protein